MQVIHFEEFKTLLENRTAMGVQFEDDELEHDPATPKLDGPSAVPKYLCNPHYSYSFSPPYTTHQPTSVIPATPRNF